jgi:hypothetical protein
MSAGGVPSACETFSYGEVEDYSIEIIDGNGNTNPHFQAKLEASAELQHHQQIYLESPTDDEALTLRIQW